MRTVLALALLALAVSAGCTAPADPGVESGTETTAATAKTAAPTTAEPPDATASETIAHASTDETTTRATTSETTAGEPRKGDQLLSVSELNESQAQQWNASKRATFGELSKERQQVVTEAVECDCNVALDGEFSFHDEDRVEVVEYDGTYYFLRVSIV